MVPVLLLEAKLLGATSSVCVCVCVCVVLAAAAASVGGSGVPYRTVASKFVSHLCERYNRQVLQVQYVCRHHY